MSSIRTTDGLFDEHGDRLVSFGGSGLSPDDPHALRYLSDDEITALARSLYPSAAARDALSRPKESTDG